LVQRGVLADTERGGYVCRADVAEVSVPATVQAAIEARIDRLSTPARRVLNAASVIGARFGAELFAALKIDPAFDELLGAELIDQVRFTPSAEYAFRHPLIRAAAYESQLRSDRTTWHRRLATAIEESDPGAAEDNAALIAEHLQAAGDLRTAYGWHMRAGAWSATRHFGAARLSWERARLIADALPTDDTDHSSMRIAPRTMLCVTDLHAKAIQDSWGRFGELRELCGATGDQVSLAIGMTGLATELLYAGRSGEGSRLASEQMILLESIGDPTLTVGLSFVPFVNWFDHGEFGKLLRWSQLVIDLADGDPVKGAGFGMGSPLAAALSMRGVCAWWLGHPGWRRDLDAGLTMARDSDPATLVLLLAWTNGLEVAYGVLRSDDSVVRAWATSGCGHRIGPRQGAGQARRRRCCHSRAARRRARAPPGEPARVRRLGSRSPRRDAVGAWPRRGSGRSSSRDRLVGEPVGRSTIAVCDITLLRLRALLARARGDDAPHRDLATRYRAKAESLGFEGHLDWAEAMLEGID
jgi:hypothetical protein